MLPREHYLKQPFQDATHFPQGFEKGGLSDIQARLVRKHGTLISALIMEEVSDATSDDLHILKVISNQSAPKNPVEQAWIKYLALVKSISSSGAGKKPTKAKAPRVPETPIAPEKDPIKPAAKAKSASSADEPIAKPETLTAQAKTEAKANKHTIKASVKSKDTLTPAPTLKKTPAKAKAKKIDEEVDAKEKVAPKKPSTKK